jgi:hypothetical protein
MVHVTSRLVNDPTVVTSSGESASEKDFNDQQRGAQDGRESQNSNAHQDKWFSNEAGQADSYRQNLSSLRQMSDDHEGFNALISARVLGSVSPSKHPKSKNKRGSYTPIAW